MGNDVLELYEHQTLDVLEHKNAQQERLARLLALCGTISDEDAAIMLQASQECRQDYGEW